MRYPNLQAIEDEELGEKLAVYFDLLQAAEELPTNAQPKNSSCSCCQKRHSYKIRNSVAGVKSDVIKICNQCDRKDLWPRRKT